jgi:DNA repair exonuclease SbcCD ATPase subunit
MTPISITIKNFKSYGDNEVTLDVSGNYARLLNGVNGAGKSTFVEAILWCLFGNSSKTSDSVDDIVNRKTKKDCKVEFIFKVGEDEYSIIRYRKHTEHKNKVLVFKNQKDISPLRSDDTQSLINEIVGLNCRALTSSMVFSMEFFTPFLRARPSDRLSIFESVLSLRDINKWSDSGKILKTVVDEKVVGIKATKDKIGFGIESIRNSIEDYRLKVKENLIQLKSKKDELLIRENKIKQEIVDLSEINYIEELKINKDYDIIKKNNDEIEKEIKDETTKLKDIDKLSLELFDTKEKLTRLAHIDVVKELGTIEELDKIKNSNLQILKKVAELKNQLIDVKSINKTILSKQEEQEKIKKRIEVALKNKCPECNQVLRNISELLDKYRKALEDSIKEIDSLTEVVNTASDKNQVISTEIFSLESQLKKEEIKSEYSVDFLKKIEQDISSFKVKKELLEKEIILNDEFNSEIKKKIDKAKSKIIEIGKTPKYSIEFLQELSNKIEMLKLENVEIQRQLETIDEKAKTAYDKKFVEDQSKKIETLLEEDNRLLSELNICEHKLKHQSYILALLSNKDGGIKKEIISRMIAVFNQEINKYLPLLFDSNIEMYFDRNLVETIIQNGEQVKFGTFSLGEKARLEFAISFSMFLLVKLFFSSNISLMIFDEVIDSLGLDRAGVDLVFKVIENIAATNSVLVISHNENLKDNFSNVISVKKEREFSYIE